MEVTSQRRAASTWARGRTAARRCTTDVPAVPHRRSLWSSQAILNKGHLNESSKALPLPPRTAALPHALDDLLDERQRKSLGKETASHETWLCNTSILINV